MSVLKILLLVLKVARNVVHSLMGKKGANDGKS